MINEIGPEEKPVISTKSASNQPREVGGIPIRMDLEPWSPDELYIPNPFPPAIRFLKGLLKSPPKTS